MELKGKRLLILGGSRISCEIIEHAKKMGIITAVTDYYPLEQSPAKQMADEAYYEDTSDVDSMVSFIKEKNFDGVITGFTDSVLPYYAEMCKKANLPAYGTREQFETFIDKKKYKELMRRYDIPTIQEYKIDLENFNSTTIGITYPVIVKPNESSGARGIKVCYSKDELKEAIDLAYNTSEDNEVIVEKYVDEPEVTVFWLFVDGKYYPMLIGNRHVKKNQDDVIPLPVGYTYPSFVTPLFLSETAPKMKKMFRDMGLKNGMMFMQCKNIDGKCFVYDVGYRLTGTLEYINLKEICGYDPLDMLIIFALTGDMGEPNIEKKVDPYLGGKYGYNVSLLCKPGTISKIVGLEEIKKIPGVIEAVVAHPEGDIITQSMKGLLTQIVIRVLGKADDVETMKNEMMKIQHLLHVISEKGDEMSLPGMDEMDFIGTIYE